MLNLNNNNFSQKAFIWLSFLMAFAIPLKRQAIPPIVLLLFISWLFESSFKQKWQNLKTNKNILIFISLYFVYLIGLLYSDNMSYGFIDVQLKFPLLLFPILYLSSESVKKTNFINFVLIAFILGNFIGTLISIVHSFVLYSNSHDLFDFYYNTLAYFIHPSYYAIHLNFCIIALLWLILTKNDIILKFKKVAFILILFFSVFIVFLNSKIGILFLGIIYLYSIYYFIKLKKYFLSISLVLLIILSVFVIVRNFPGITNRIVSATEVLSKYNNIEKKSVDGTAERIMIWKTSIEIISDNLFFGVGTGDVKDILLSKYKENNTQGAYEKKLNAHNQFLQTTISLGLVGFIIIIFMFIYPLIYSIKNKNLLYYYFILLVAMNFLVESMLETQTGVTFYAFFNTLLFFEISKNAKSV